MSKILVTGGAGFIGSNLVDALIEKNHEVVVVDNLVTGKKEYLNSQAKFYELDISSSDIKKVFEEEKFEFIFHVAAQIDVRLSVKDPAYDAQVNVFGGLNILQNCLAAKVKKIIFTSTGGAVYGDLDEIPTTEKSLPQPISPYGIHKLTFEKYLNYFYQVYGQKFITLRPANIYGPRQFKGGEAGVVSIFIDNAVNDIQSTINGDGLQTRDFLYVDDLVNAFIKAMEIDFIGEINIGTRIETNLLQVIEAIENAQDQKLKKKFGPAKAGEQARSCLDASLAKEVLNWQAEIDLQAGIKRTLAWSKGLVTK
jgi:UDP-glucose 4-epimerase